MASFLKDMLSDSNNKKPPAPEMFSSIDLKIIVIANVHGDKKPEEDSELCNEVISGVLRRERRVHMSKRKISAIFQAMEKTQHPIYKEFGPNPSNVEYLNQELKFLKEDAMWPYIQKLKSQLKSLHTTRSEQTDKLALLQSSPPQQQPPTIPPKQPFWKLHLKTPPTPAQPSTSEQIAQLKHSLAEIEARITVLEERLKVKQAEFDAWNRKQREDPISRRNLKNVLPDSICPGDL